MNEEILIKIQMSVLLCHLPTFLSFYLIGGLRGDGDQGVEVHISSTLLRLRNTALNSFHIVAPWYCTQPHEYVA